MYIYVSYNTYIHQFIMCRVSRIMAKMNTTKMECIFDFRGVSSSFYIVCCLNLWRYEKSWFMLYIFCSQLFIAHLHRCVTPILWHMWSSHSLDPILFFEIPMRFPIKMPFKLFIIAQYQLNSEFCDEKKRKRIIIIDQYFHQFGWKSV